MSRSRRPPHAALLGLLSFVAWGASPNFAGAGHALGPLRWRRMQMNAELPASGITTGDLALGGLALAFGAAYLPQVLGLKGAAYQVGRFRYYANRGEEAFSEAIHRLAQQYPGGPKEDLIFSYFDTFGGAQMPTLGSEAVLRLMDRDVTNIYDHKRGLEERLREFGCAGANGPFAATYFTAEEALQATDDVGSDVASDVGSAPLFFAKLPEQSGGRGIQVLRREDLAESARSEYVFQRAIQDLELIDGRKFVVRFFFWVYQGSIYLHQHGVLIVHGARYDANSVEAAVQFQHDWYDNDSETYLLTLQSSDQASQWRSAIAQRLLEAAPALEPLLRQTRQQRNCYTLVGGDALIQSNGDAKLIELNMYPNLFSGCDLVDKEVFLPVLEDMVVENCSSWLPACQRMASWGQRGGPLSSSLPVLQRLSGLRSSMTVAQRRRYNGSPGSHPKTSGYVSGQCLLEMPLRGPMASLQQERSENPLHIQAFKIFLRKCAKSFAEI